MITTTETITMTYGPFENDVFIAGIAHLPHRRDPHQQRRSRIP